MSAIFAMIVTIGCGYVAYDVHGEKACLVAVMVGVTGGIFTPVILRVIEGTFGFLERNGEKIFFTALVFFFLATIGWVFFCAIKGIHPVVAFRFYF